MSERPSLSNIGALSGPRPNVYSLLPGDLAPFSGRNSASYLFGRVQRAGTWLGRGVPDMGKQALALLQSQFDFTLPEVARVAESADGSTKLVVMLADGQAVETVHMPRDVRTPRVTLCVSSQVGCAMGCTFCHTGTMGLIRQLTASEIVSQVLLALDLLGPKDLGLVTLVFMGMGEPLHNLPEVLRAVEVLAHPNGLGIAPSRMTVSTSGLVPGIDKLAEAAVRPCLAVSLNATTDEARARTMPVTKTWGLASLREALQRFPLRPHEKLTLEYVALAGENDTDEDADRLADFATGLKHNVNVIPFNAYEGALFGEPAEDRLRAFVQRLRERGCLATIRYSRGRDAQAACGQLVQLTQSLSPRRRGVARTRTRQ